jgi:sulfate transport system substrate-binding protein
MWNPVQQSKTDFLALGRRFLNGLLVLILILFTLPLLDVVRKHVVLTRWRGASAPIQPVRDEGYTALSASPAALNRPEANQSAGNALEKSPKPVVLSAETGGGTSQITRLVQDGSAAAAVEPRASSGAVPAEAKLLNVSYDVTREFYQDYNKDFASYWKEKTGGQITVNQSNGGSSKQARSVLDGLEADVITMNQPLDIDVLHERGHLLPQDWSARLPNNSVPYNSTILFVVRKGNPKKLVDWSDLVRTNVSIVVPNPKTSGNGRYSYLAAWGYALKKSSGDEAAARKFVEQLFANIPVLAVGGRDATTTFTDRGVGDVLLTFENEAIQVVRESGDKLEIVVPSISVLTENPVAWVDTYVNRHHSEKLARSYLEYLYSDAGQELAAKYNFRPINKSILAKHADQFEPLELFTVAEIAGDWQKAYRVHFAEGGYFDQLYQTRR